jgi:2'-5' RNA ligase
MIRAFVAIALPEEVAGDLIAAQAGLPAGRPVEPGNLHLTVAFLGEHPGPVIEDAHFAFAGFRLPAFELTLEGLGLFGEPRPRVLHAGVRPEPGLTRLREKVVQAARGAGLDLGRERYQPHVTLARFNRGLDGADALRVRDFAGRGAGFRSGPFRVESFGLWRSFLGRSGPVYEEMAEYALDLSPVRGEVGRHPGSERR